MFNQTVDGLHWQLFVLFFFYMWKHNTHMPLMQHRKPLGLHEKETSAFIVYPPSAPQEGKECVSNKT